MTKRAHKKHVRKPRDLYETPPSAVAPLLPHLEPGTLFVEPCCASGHLVRALEAHGHFCVAASDIQPLDPDFGTLDALQLQKPPPGVMIITNPPWSRSLLHEMIVHFSDLAPTWLLFDADWAHIGKAQAYLTRCRKIVSVGRVKWIFEGSKNTGFDNAAWHLFDRPQIECPPLFYGRGILPAEHRKARRVCARCGELIDRFGKWQLVEHNGVAAPEHINCDNPSSRRAVGEVAEPLPAPLFDWGFGGQGHGGDRERP